MKPTFPTVQEVLHETRSRLITNGWTHAEQHGTALCLVATLESIIPPEQWPTVGLVTLEALRMQLPNELSALTHRHCPSIILWNLKQTSIDAVLTLLDRTISATEN
jgi:hypothetical protein